MSSISSLCLCKNKVMVDLRDENKRQYLTICSLISQNEELRKSSKKLRMKLVFSKKEGLRFKIDQTKKYHVLLQTNRKIMKMHDIMSKCVDNLKKKNNKLQTSLDNVMDFAVEGVKDSALCDGINFNVDDFSVNEIMTTENKNVVNETETETPKDIELSPEITDSITPNISSESSVETVVNETETKTSNDVKSSPEITDPIIPSTPPESPVDESLMIDNDSDESTPKKPVSVIKKRKRSKSPIKVRTSNRLRNKKKNK